MKPKILVLALLLATLTGGPAIAQTSGLKAEDTIRLGNERYARAEYEAAIELYRRVPRDAGAIYAQALYNIGVCYYELWLTEDAILMYRRAVEARRGRYPKALYALGVALEYLKRLPEAKEAYRQAIKTSGGAQEAAAAAAAHYRLGLLVVNDGDTEGAAALFREAIARSGGQFPMSHNNLGVMLARLGRLAEAEREFEIALEQASGEFDEAAHNLKLCRSLLTAPMKNQLAALKVVQTIDAFIK